MFLLDKKCREQKTLFFTNNPADNDEAYPINSTLRSLLPPIPSHNNNQPFRNVNLTIGEIDVRGPGGLLSSNNVFGTINNEDSSVVPVYSLFGDAPADAAGNNNNVVGVLNGDAQGRRHDDRGVEEEGGGEQLLEERVDDQNLRFVMNEFGFVELLNGDDDGSGSSSSTTSSSSSSSSESSVVNGVDDDEDDLSEADASGSSIAMEEEEEESEDDEDLTGCVQNGVDSSCSSSSDEGVLLEQRDNNDNEQEQRNGAISSNLGNSTISCVTCGCYGLQDEFYDRVHCSYDCEVMSRAGERREMVRRLVEDGVIEEGDEVGVLCFEGMIGGGDGGDDEGDEEGEEDEDDDEEECQEEEDEEDEETQLPVKRFKLDDYRGGVTVKLENPFRVNDLLEAIDPEHQSLFCPVKVVEIIGYRLLLKFIGYSDKYNFWVNADSEYIFPVNWSTKTIKTLHFHTPDNFTTWEEYIRVNPHYRVAPTTNFKHIEGLLTSSIPGLRVGMKLEAVDVRSGSLLVCVATVSSVMGDRFLVHFDSWDSLYDYWVRFGDQGVVFPVGYCGGRGVEITPPHCYETPSEFNWNEYLKKTNSTPMPSHLFNKQPNSTPPKTRTFQLNQQVEVIDKRSPRLLRRAKIIAMKNNAVTVRFNGLDEIYDYDISTDSPDLHEEGWGEATGHPVVSEDDPDVEDLENVEYAVCPNHKVCKSVSSYRNVSVGVHSRLKDCAFFKGNMGGSSGGLFRYTDRVVVFEDKYYDLGGGKGTGVDDGGDGVEEEHGKKDGECMDVDGEEQQQRGSDTVKTEVIEEGGSRGNDDSPVTDVVVTDHHGLGSATEPPTNHNPDIITSTPTEIKTEGIETKASVSIPNPTTTTPTLTPIPIPTTLPTKSKPKPEEEEELTIPHRSEILTWTNSQISRLVKQICSNLPTCELVASKFCNNLIDGESFLMLTQNDMTEVLGIKLGPAIKIFNVIRIVNSRNK